MQLELIRWKGAVRAIINSMGHAGMTRSAIRNSMGYAGMTLIGAIRNNMGHVGMTLIGAIGNSLRKIAAVAFFTKKINTECHA